MPNSSPVPRSGIVPLLVHEAHAAEAVNAYFTTSGPEAFDRSRGERPEDAPWGSYRVENGVALIPVLGSLVPRGLFLGFGFITSYEALRSELRRAAEDPSVESVALMIDSPGGYVSGIDATAAAIRALAEQKKVTAYVQGMACSAAYWLASACDEIVCSPLAELGSIGVVQAHFDFSGVLQQIGIKVTLLHAGAKKVDGNPYEPLSDRVKAEMEQRLEDLRLAFAEAVAEGRSSLDVAAVLATEAATYVGDEAVKRGLADRVGFLADDIPDADELPSLSGRFMESIMNYTQAQLDAAVAQAKAEAQAAGHSAGHVAGLAEGKASGVAEGHAAGKAEGLKEGAAAERGRIEAILGCEEAKGREAQAMYFATKTEFPADVAKGALAAAPKGASTTTSTLDSEMTQDRQPSVGADGGKEFSELKGEQRGAAIATLLGYAAKKPAA